LFEPLGDLFCEAEKLVNSGFLAAEAILEGVEMIVTHQVRSKAVGHNLLKECPKSEGEKLASKSQAWQKVCQV
jgi:hypothetical protein